MINFQPSQLIRYAITCCFICLSACLFTCFPVDAATDTSWYQSAASVGAASEKRFEQCRIMAAPPSYALRIGFLITGTDRHDFLADGSDGEQRELYMLHGERDADNGYRAGYRHNQMAQRQPPACDDKP